MVYLGPSHKWLVAMLVDALPGVHHPQQNIHEVLITVSSWEVPSKPLLGHRSWRSCLTGSERRGEVQSSDSGIPAYPWEMLWDLY